MCLGRAALLPEVRHSSITPRALFALAAHQPGWRSPCAAFKEGRGGGSPHQLCFAGPQSPTIGAAETFLGQRPALRWFYVVHARSSTRVFQVPSPLLSLPSLRRVHIPAKPLPKDLRIITFSPFLFLLLILCKENPL